jgi:membrane-associated PAP2 superfamily phosphatase
LSSDSIARPLHSGARPVFWRTHALVPGLLFVVAFLLLEAFSLDRVIAQAWYFDAMRQHWLGEGAGSWWARGLLHTGGRWAIRVVAAAALLAWVFSFRVAALRPLRRQAGFVFLAMLVSISIVGLLKSVTNVDCPWDLLGFGGDRPYVSLFADRPNYLPRAACFPGAHASSGFSLLCFYLALRDVRKCWAHWALAIALVVGTGFAVGQEARGAHFFTHDLASAAIVWFIELGLYAWLLKPRQPAD